MTASDVIEVDSDSNDTRQFKASDWIGTGKTYPIDSTPVFIQEALAKLLTLTPEDSKYLPSSNTSIAKLLEYKLPEQSQALLSAKPTAWFSSETPTSSLVLLLKRPIPPKNILSRIRGAVGQSWFDGAQSIRDPRYNNSSERFPLTALSLWERLAKAVAMRRSWDEAKHWFHAHQESVSRELVNQVRQSFQVLPWVKGVFGQQEDVMPEVVRLLDSVPPDGKQKG